MFVQKRTFLHTISKEIKMRRTADYLPNMVTKGTLKNSLTKVLRLLVYEDFNVTKIVDADNQFECLLRDEMLPIAIDICAAGEHVPAAERSIRVVEEHARVLTQGLPYRRYPRALVNGIVKKAIQGLNSFPSKTGISDTISPRMVIVTKRGKIDYNHLRLEFGEYSEVHLRADPTNTSHT